MVAVGGDRDRRRTCSCVVGRIARVRDRSTGRLAGRQRGTHRRIATRDAGVAAVLLPHRPARARVARLRRNARLHPAAGAAVMMDDIVRALLAAGVFVTVASSLAMLAFHRVYDRLHLITPITSLG